MITSQPQKILFFAEAVTLAHIARCIAIAEKLHVTGKYSITLAADNRYDSVLGTVPFSRIPLHSISSDFFAKKLAQGLPIYSTETLTDYVNEDLAIIDSIKPDFIIGDFRLSLAISSRLKKIPYATITNAYWSPYADIVYPVPEIALTKILGIRLAQKVFNIVRPWAFKLHAFAFNRVCKKFRQPVLPYDLREIYTHADYTFYADIESLIPMKSLPNNHLFIGPILWSAQVSLPDWWESLPTDKPIIFVTLGSSGDSALLPKIIEALQQMTVTVICITANKTSFPQTYSNVYYSSFLPADLAVKKADIVICNGGSPMVYQCIAENKAIIGLPGNLDQYLMMSLAQKAGYGELIRSGEMDKVSIQKAVNRAIIKKTDSSPPHSDYSIDINKIISIIDSHTRQNRF